MPSISQLIKSVSELLTVVQTNPMLLVVLVAIAALVVVAMALRVVHTVVSKK